MPALGLGTYMLPPDQCGSAIRTAIQAGYRRIDCAPVYFNEDQIGNALALAMEDGLVAREDLYMVSKLPSPFHKRELVETALRKTLNDLQLDYLDLYLIHWPVAFLPVDLDPTVRGYDNEEIDESDNGRRIDPSVSIHETWAAMEDLVDKGLVRDIGVSNFPVSLLHELLTSAKIKPAVNQCEAHPYLQQPKLVRYCQARGIGFQAYSALGTTGYKEPDEPSVLEDATLQLIADRHGVSTATVCLAWALQRGTSVVVKSATAAHQRDNLAASALHLTPADMLTIASIDRNYRYFRPEDWWGDMPVAVFD